MAFFPYLLYLIFYRTKLNTKHYLLLIFFGLNTDITTDLFFIPYALLIIFFIDKKLILENFKTLIKILGIFFVCAMLTSINFIYIQFLDLEMHRIEYTKNSITFLNNLIQKIMNILFLPSSFNWAFVKILPYTLISILIIFLLFYPRIKL